MSMEAVSFVRVFFSLLTGLTQKKSKFVVRRDVARFSLFLVARFLLLVVVNVLWHLLCFCLLIPLIVKCTISSLSWSKFVVRRDVARLALSFSDDCQFLNFLFFISNW